ncbi:MAG TPA: hypothetical protein V6D14_10780 [Coleofasciculaceae cyanobacterium]
MKRHLRITINFLASLFVMVLGTMQAAQAEEVWLDFSVPQTDVSVAAPIVIRDDEAAATASISQPSSLSPELSLVRGASQSAPSLIATANSTDAIAFKQVQKASEMAAKLIALDFNVPNVGSAPALVASESSGATQRSNIKLMSPVKTEVLPPPKPVSRAPTTSTVKTPAAKPLNGQTKSKQVTALRRAIVGQESNGKFWLVNPDSGALGYGQLLRENVAPWTKAALGKPLTPEQFLANPDAQIKTIDHKLNEYLKRELAYTGDTNEELAIRRVASTWYSGNPRLWNDTRPQYSNGQRYPSIESYTYSVWKRYLREIG